MQISITEPLKRAYAHMQRMLFAPFDLGKWLVIGFGCWLAQLTGGGSGGGNFPSWIASVSDDSDAASFTTWDWSDVWTEQPWMLGCGALAVLAVVFVLALIPLLIWLSSRGHFVFLDNVIRDRAETREPWNRFATEGNSLFLWRLGFMFAVIFLVLLAAIPIIAVMYSLQNRGSFEIGEIAAVVASVIPVAVAVVTVMYTHLFLMDFVVPIMRQHGLTTNAAWRHFLPLLRENLGSFLIYGLFIVLLWIGVGIGLCLVILFTCCIAAIPLIIPYIGTVALLPIYVVFRAYSVEFLGQWMPEVGLPSPDPEPVIEAIAA